MSTVADLRRLSTAQLARAVRVLIDKGDHAADKAEQFYKAAGVHLRKLKEDRKSVDVKGICTWEEFVKERCGISRSRADTLIMLADGRTTLEKVRADRAESVRKVRAQQQSPLRSGGRSLTVVEEADEPEPEPDVEDDAPCDNCTPEQQWQNSVSNHALEAAAMQALWSRLFGAGWKTFPVTEQMTTLAAEAASVWAAVANDLREREPDVEDEMTEVAEDTSSKPPTQRQLRRLFLSQAGLACQAALQPYVKELRPHREIASAAQQVAGVWAELAARLGPSDEEPEDPENHRTAFLITADTAAEMAVKCRRLASSAPLRSGDRKELLTMARRVAAAWNKTVEELK